MELYTWLLLGAAWNLKMGVSSIYVIDDVIPTSDLKRFYLVICGIIQFLNIVNDLYPVIK